MERIGLLSGPTSPAVFSVAGLLLAHWVYCTEVVISIVAMLDKLGTVCETCKTRNSLRFVAAMPLHIIVKSNLIKVYTLRPTFCIPSNYFYLYCPSKSISPSILALEPLFVLFSCVHATHSN